MQTELKQQVTRSYRSLAALAGTAVLSSTMLTMLPTSASAFDVGGLIGTAVALSQYGGYRVGPSGYRTNVHVSTARPDRGSAGKQKNAPEVDATEESGKTDTKANSISLARNQPSEPEHNTAQASAPGAGYASDEPTFSPSR